MDAALEEDVVSGRKLTADQVGSRKLEAALTGVGAFGALGKNLRVFHAADNLPSGSSKGATKRLEKFAAPSRAGTTVVNAIGLLTGTKGLWSSADDVVEAGVDTSARTSRHADPINVDVPEPKRIYSARELARRADEPGPFHNFPESFNDDIFKNGKRTKVPNFFNKDKAGLSNDSIQYRLPGTVNGRDGVFEIFTRPSLSGKTEVIIHRFFKPNPK